ncbi:BRO-N domain-containing protein [Caldimonas sp. KR1-144]|uniref:BRO-N domain-containing protein n=1 Tax=Caldimonas sp. KR1-144 TaxID=3400911 RepID=UPI003C02D019
MCRALDFRDAFNATRGLDDDERGMLKASECEGLPNRGLVIVNESGLYSLILRSRKPEAQAFRKWVTSEVLSNLRKHGVATTRTVAAAVVSGEMTPAELMARAVLAANETISTRFFRGLSDKRGAASSPPVPPRSQQGAQSGCTRAARASRGPLGVGPSEHVGR